MPGTAGATTASPRTPDQVRGAQGRQRPLGRHDGDHRRPPRTRRRRTSSSTSCSTPPTAPGSSSNILYKVPYKAAMDAVDPALLHAISEPRHAAGRPDQVRAAARPRPGAEGLFAGRLGDHGGEVSSDPCRQSDQPRAPAGADRCPGCSISAGSSWLVSLLRWCLRARRLRARHSMAAIDWTSSPRQTSRARSTRSTCGILLDSARIAATATVVALADRLSRRLCHRAEPAAPAAAAAGPGHAAVLEQLSDPHLCLDRAAQPRGPDQPARWLGSAGSASPCRCSTTSSPS